MAEPDSHVAIELDPMHSEVASELPHDYKTVPEQTTMEGPQLPNGTKNKLQV